MVIRLSILRAAALFLSLPASAFCGSNVVNLSHYDMMRPDFAAMKREGVLGVIHEATYPRLERDAKYLDRQMGALQAGLLWGAYHYADGTDPVRQADHFLSVVSNSWSQAASAARGPGVLLVLDFEKNGHYPGGTMRADQAVSFVERIRQRTGTYPGIYSGEYHLQQVLNSPRISNAQKSVLTNCWLWIANYHKEPRATAPWNFWSLWQYCGDGKCGLPRSSYPISIANIKKAERNIFRGNQSDLQEFWQRRAWQPSGGKSRREPDRTVAAD
ncbi:MAG TPA: glycoside hydrolase family 25 protein [Candidatus Udaeobacter sp.]|jgi:lysozyme|nr:glycoside hydrolase family 25 protein [Candidatus Udaeobacter sp.]